MLWLLLGAGCASSRPAVYLELPEPPTESVRAQMRRVALVHVVGPAEFRPDTPMTKAEAASRYGKQAFWGCLLGAAGAERGAVLVLAAMPLVVGGNVVFGSVAGVSDAQVRTAAEALHRALTSVTASGTLQQTVVGNLQRFEAETIVAHATIVRSNQSQPALYAPGDFAGAQSVVEVGPVEIQLLGAPGPDPPLQLVARLPVRVVRLADGTALYAGHCLYHGPRHKLLDWARNGASLWQEQLTRALEELATQLGPQLFQVWATGNNPPEPRQWTGIKAPRGCGWLAGLFARYRTDLAVVAAGPWPVEPPLATGLHCWEEDSEQAFFRWPTLPADQVRLSWEAAPAGVELAAAPSYDLCVWRGVRGFPAQLVYERQGLPEPAHTLSEPLMAGQEYFWSVRVRRQEHGRTRLSAWAHIVEPVPAGTRRYINFNHPDPRFFRFHTR